MGLISSNDESFVVNSTSGHPLQTIDNSWGDICMNASMESILGGNSDARAGSYFENL